MKFMKRIFIVTFQLFLTLALTYAIMYGLWYVIVREPEFYKLTSKDNIEECQITQQCKITVVRDYRGYHPEDPKQFYKCIVSNEYFNLISENDAIEIDVNKCERVNP